MKMKMSKTKNNSSSTQSSDSATNSTYRNRKRTRKDRHDDTSRRNNPLAAARAAGSGGVISIGGGHSASASASANTGTVTSDVGADLDVIKSSGTNKNKKKRLLGKDGGPNNVSNSNSSSISKSDARAEQIWHRRTGGGLRLFVEYYSNQPAGVVVVDDDDNTGGGEGGYAGEGDSDGVGEKVGTELHGRKLEAEYPKNQQNIRGMSRAAKKKRRKKEQQQQQQNSNTNEDTMITMNDDEQQQGRQQEKGHRDQSQNILKNRLRVESSTGPDSELTELLYDGQLMKMLPNDGSSQRDRRLRSFFLAVSRPLPVSFRFRLLGSKTDTNGDNKNDNIRLRMIEEQERARTELHTNPQLSKYIRPIFTNKNKNNKKGMSEGDDFEDDSGNDNNTIDAYQTIEGISKMELSKSSKLASLKQFLHTNSQNGVLARQEVGSMLPVWILHEVMMRQAEAYDKDATTALTTNRPASVTTTWTRVLDMCASPGSKTMQAAEHVMDAQRKHKMNHGRRQNMNRLRQCFRVRANDVNSNRLDALKSAVERSGLFRKQQKEDEHDDDDESDIIHYANVDATQYPLPSKESKCYPVVLCDVPCSGDGTCRKDFHVLPTWYPHIGNMLHTTQVAILVRALQCVAVNGYVAYSTCSLNPVEDEAVVCTALEQIDDIFSKKRRRQEEKQNQKLKRDRHESDNSADGNKDSDSTSDFELVSLKSIFDGKFVLRPGVSDWRVADISRTEEIGKRSLDGGNELVKMDNEDDDDDEKESAKLQWYHTYEDAKERGMVGLTKALWPRRYSGEGIIGGCRRQQHDLSKCVRLWPQDQDTGGFFVAIIRRVR